jgi:PGF-pre-PGF domain-containing protein
MVFWMQCTRKAVVFYKTIYRIIVAIVILSLAVHPSIAETTVSIIPSQSNINAGENFSIDINIDPDETFVGAQMNILFDEELISASKLEESELFADSGLYYIFNSGTIDNSHGFINDIFAVTLGGSGIRYEGNFIHIDMQAGDKAGNCNIRLENVLLSNSEGIAIPISTNNVDVKINTEGSGQVATTQTASGGGGGGGGASTGESADNIELTEAKSIYVLINNQASYLFEDENNPITSIAYRSLKNAGIITGTIEVLKGKSIIVADDPSGLIYKNVNIWLGKTGYASENNIGSPIINFKVSKQWIETNDITEDSIILKRYNSDKWNRLVTIKTGEDENNIFFKSETPGFSPFSIVSDSAEEMEITDKNNSISTQNENSPVKINKASEEQTLNTNPLEKEEKTLDQNTVLISCLFLLFLAYRKKQL